jgi:hypothetical protein
MCLLIGAVVGEKAQGPVDEVVATSLQAMPQVLQEVAQLSQALRGVRRASDQISSTASLQRLIALEGFPLWSPGSCKPSVCAVAAVAILVSSITTLLSLRTQRENTRTTLDVQERLSVAQEQALRERSQAQDLRDKRVHPYISLIKWAERLLAALTEMNEDSNPYRSLQDWNMRRHVCGVIHPRPTCSPTDRTLRRTFDGHR